MRTRAGRVRAKQAASRQAWQKQPKKQTSQPHGEAAAKTRKNSQVLQSDKTAKTPEDLAAFTASGTAQTPAHNDIICAGFAFSAGAPLASPPSFQRAPVRQPRPAWAAPRQGGLLFSSAFSGCFGINRFAHPPFLLFREWLTKEQ